MFSNIYKVLNIALLKQFDKCLLQVKPILFLFKTATHRKLLVCVSGTWSETKIFSFLNFHRNEGMLLVYIVLLTFHNDVQDQKHNFELRKNDFMLIICHL